MAMPEPAQATFFDGETARRHPVLIAFEPGGQPVLVISGETLPEALRWPLHDLRALSDHAAGGLTLTLRADTSDESPRDPARLVVIDRSWVAWIEQSRPELFKRDVRQGTGLRIVKRIGLAVGALLLMLFVILPALADRMAELIPLKREIAFGKTVVAQVERLLGGERLGALLCEAPEGQAALAAMANRIQGDQAFEYDLDIQVFDHEMVNAFAAPGGQIVLLRGLIESADGPDTVAAVLAHEIGHVESRDATRLSLRTAGSAGLLSMVLGDFAGGAAAVLIAEQMFQARYTREAEAEADLFAIERLNAAGVSTQGMADFFAQLDQEDGMALPILLSTHPELAARAERAKQNADAQTTVTQVISDAEWQALRKICED